ncbi:MAG: type III-B CRISPR module-associated protein Cmr5 [Dictyoglomus sp.]|nr:type III-B CRISPR module-associated protein Cmr5 [Dictyoglomus sp.]MCX7942575.1 type III-B CRISPR module-associated protein Cmr5 [Dictyoglomaceae bacterium]MDW8188813.1 type III-B CRISPR module-associated protein Cmr5 [Dictyoglomus sp.]
MSEKETIITKLEKGRAEFAYNCVKEAIKFLDVRKKKEYRSYIRKIPQMILSNGLGQTLAFIYSKKEDGNAYDLIYKQFINYLKSDSPARIKIPTNENELIEWVISLDSYNYRYVTEELLAFLNWLKRFAEGMIEEEEE